MNPFDSRVTAAHAAGALTAQRLVHELGTGTAAPGAVLAVLAAVLAHGEPERLAAFAREIEKALQRSGACEAQP
ncbi:MAG: hypothetical protein JNL30_01125 [Rubrivivax sp.]|nr:hypothetical protein [Rubrivivax sp.]